MPDLFGYSAMPGLSAAAVTAERSCLWGGTNFHLIKGVAIDSAAVDAGNTPTTELRHGLLMGIVTATGLAKQYDPTATDGTNFVAGVLLEARRMTDNDAAAVQRMGMLLVSGPVRASQLLGLDMQARRQMHGRFVFDDRLFGAQGGWLEMIPKTADYTVVNDQDNDVCFTTRGAAGAVNFTLPATISRGQRFGFASEANQNMTVTAPAAKLVTFNNVAATSVALSTAGQKIGGMFEIIPNDDLSKYIAIPKVYPGQTITVA